jgi:hypothetical protein
MSTSSFSFLLRRLLSGGALLLATVGGAGPARAQQPAPAGRPAAGFVTLSGTLRDEASGEALVGATVRVPALTLGATTDERGAYALRLPAGTHRVSFASLGYAPQTVELTLTSDATRSLALRAQQVQTDEVLVQARRPDQNVQSTEMGVTRLDLRTVRLVPALLGEVDVVRTLLLLPGVSTVGEGASGFNVRGGGIDQNLVLLDEAPIYNSSHLFGLFSVFNPDAVKDLRLVKGGIPAAYGGRLSSLLDVRLKDGTTGRRAVTGGIGSISSRLAVETPLVKDKATLVLAGRRSYGDLFLKLIPAQRDNVAYFYDLTAKLNYQLGARDQVSVSGYLGRDVFGFGDQFRNDFGNRLTTVTWRHGFTDRLSATATGTASQYDYGLGVPAGFQGFDWQSSITSYTGKADFHYQLRPQSLISFGASLTRYQFTPGTVRPTDPTSIFRPLSLQRQRGNEYALYADHEVTLTARLAAQYGLRLTGFDYLGAGTVYEYAGPDGRQKTPVNPREYGAGDRIRRYVNPEPRASLRYTLSETSSLKASYNRLAQYIHLVSNTTASSPLDVWTPSTNNTRPARADQVALGYFRNFKDNAYEASVEVYGKQMDNQVDYIDGANTLLNEYLEADLLYGRGRAYGAEFYVKKNQGPLTGWLSYTLSRSERQVDGLNNNNWYVTKYDKTHNLALVGIYALSSRWTLSGTFNYSTGIAATFPDSRVVYEGLIIPNVNGNVRNNYRVPAYHRLDLAATLQGRKGRGPRWAPAWESNWVFSVYNAYARRNAYSIYFRPSTERPGTTEAVRLAIFGTVLPAVTYNFNF